jgi:hypothetical protein
MAMVIVGLLKDAHQARGVIRALDDAGFSGDDIDMSGGLLSELVLRGVADEDAQAFAEGVRRGGALVCVRTDDEEEAAEAADLMCAHGAVDIDACTIGWKGDAARFGEYPSAPGRIYPDPRRHGYSGPERRVRDEPYPGGDRRAI